MDLALDDSAVDSKMPANPASVISLATFYLLRELELSAARVEDLLLNHDLGEVLLRLPMSKNDATAKGAERPGRALHLRGPSDECPPFLSLSCCCAAYDLLDGGLRGRNERP